MSTDACFVLLMVIVVQRYAFFLNTPNLPFVFLIGLKQVGENIVKCKRTYCDFLIELGDEETDVRVLICIFMGADLY